MHIQKTWHPTAAELNFFFLLLCSVLGCKGSQGCGMQSHDECVAVAVQLAECEERTRRAENLAASAHDQARALREQLGEANSQVQQLKHTAASCHR